MRYRNVIAAGLIAGVGGAYFTLGSVGAFGKNMSSGEGYIALAAMIFGRYTPFGAIGAALLFGFATQMQSILSTLNTPIQSNLLLMAPYIVTIIVLAGLVGKAEALRPRASPTSRHKFSMPNGPGCVALGCCTLVGWRRGRAWGRGWCGACGRARGRGGRRTRGRRRTGGGRWVWGGRNGWFTAGRRLRARAGVLNLSPHKTLRITCVTFAGRIRAWGSVLGTGVLPEPPPSKCSPIFRTPGVWRFMDEKQLEMSGASDD